MAELNFHLATAIFRVSRLAASLDYYLDALGFRLDWNHAARFASVSRGPANLMLSENDQGTFGSWVWVGVGDVVALYDEFRSSGAIIKLPPRNYPWAREIHVGDPDGNVIRFGSDPDETSGFDEWVEWYWK
jgi:catechol 2,3-dioxygenase-like lactoylglutathione lyase family enzyme